MINRAASMMLPGWGMEEAAALAASRDRRPSRGHAGGWEPPREGLDVEDGPEAREDGDGPDERPAGRDRDRDLALDLIRLVRALVWAAILSQLATLGLVGGMSGVNLAIQSGWLTINAGPATGEGGKP